MPTVDKHLYTEELPNLKFVGKDKPHAARRIARRPWEADKYLWSVFTLWVWGKRSFAALIEYSVEFRNWFQDNIAKCDVGFEVGRRIKSPPPIAWPSDL